MLGPNLYVTVYFSMVVKLIIKQVLQPPFMVHQYKDNSCNSMICDLLIHCLKFDPNASIPNSMVIETKVGIRCSL